MIKLKPLIAEMFNKVISMDGGIWFWLDKHGNLYKTDSHFRGGMEYINNISGFRKYDINKQRDSTTHEVYDEMFKLGFLAVRKYDNQPIYFYYNPKINKPTYSQLKTLKKFGEDYEVDAIDDVTHLSCIY